MSQISQNELTEILESYGIINASLTQVKFVTPDSAIYVFSDKNGTNYVLYAADYLGGYEDIKLPYNFEFDYGFPYSTVSFQATKILSYKDDAKKKADGYIDDNHYWTKASTGDVCMLFECSNLKID